MNNSCGPLSMCANLPRQGLALILCAPSGAGKTTLVHRLMEEFPELVFSISATTRSPRQGEVDGKDYLFLSKEDFLARREAGAFAEWAEVHGNFYGTPLKEARDQLAAGQDVLFDIDVQGAAQLHLTLPHSLCVFCFPPSLAILEKRLRNRGTDDEASIRKRLQAARGEIAQARWFDLWIVNDCLEDAYAVLRGAYIAASHSPSLCPQLPHFLLTGEQHG